MTTKIVHIDCRLEEFKQRYKRLKLQSFHDKYKTQIILRNFMQRVVLSLEVFSLVRVQFLSLSLAFLFRKINLFVFITVDWKVWSAYWWRWWMPNCNNIFCFFSKFCINYLLLSTTNLIESITSFQFKKYILSCYRLLSS